MRVAAAAKPKTSRLLRLRHGWQAGERGSTNQNQQDQPLEAKKDLKTTDLDKSLADLEALKKKGQSVRMEDVKGLFGAAVELKKVKQMAFAWWPKAGFGP